MRTLIKATLVLFLTLGISPSASAQPESLDALLNEEASVGGLDSEVDAAPAQAEAIAAGELVTITIDVHLRNIVNRIPKTLS